MHETDRHEKKLMLDRHFLFHPSIQLACPESARLTEENFQLASSISKLAHIAVTNRKSFFQQSLLPTLVFMSMRKRKPQNTNKIVFLLLKTCFFVICLIALFDSIQLRWEQYMMKYFSLARLDLCVSHFCFVGFF